MSRLNRIHTGEVRGGGGGGGGGNGGLSTHCFINSFNILSCVKSIVSSKASSPNSAP
jgi:hypothetical protein